MDGEAELGGEGLSEGSRPVLVQRGAASFRIFQEDGGSPKNKSKFISLDSSALWATSFSVPLDSGFFVSFHGTNTGSGGVLTGCFCAKQVPFKALHRRSSAKCAHTSKGS